MRSNAVGGGGGYCTLSLAWEGAVMMPLQSNLMWFSELRRDLCDSGTGTYLAT
jgi:hypothetical protein